MSSASRPAPELVNLPPFGQLSLELVSLTGDLLVRIVNQAIDYGELMLTIEEFTPFWQWTTEHPGASCSIGGRLYVFEKLPVHVLELA